MDVQPKVYTGLPEFGYEVDSALQAFNKYNRHSHSFANPTSFLAEDIDIGDEVEVLGADGRDIFYRPTPSTKVLVTDITENSITVSAASSEEVIDGVLSLSRGQTIENINVSLNSALITRQPRAGFISPKLIDSSVIKTNSIYAVVPENTLGGSPDTEESGAFTLDARTTTITVSGTGITGTATLPALNFYRGKRYSFSFTQTAAAGRRIYILSNPTYTLNQHPPGNNYTLGIQNHLINNTVTGFDFTIPYSAPSPLYYICPSLVNKVGLINIFNSDLDELPWSVGSIQSNISAVLPEGLPDFSLPIILDASSNIRLSSVNILPIWSNPFSAGRFLVRLLNTKDNTATYLTNKQRINSIGKFNLNAPPKLLNKNSTTQILLYEIEGLKAIVIETNYLSLI